MFKTITQTSVQVTKSVINKLIPDVFRFPSVIMLAFLLPQGNLLKLFIVRLFIITVTIAGGPFVVGHKDRIIVLVFISTILELIVRWCMTNSLERISSSLSGFIKGWIAAPMKDFLAQRSFSNNGQAQQLAHFFIAG